MFNFDLIDSVLFVHNHLENFEIRLKLRNSMQPMTAAFITFPQDTLSLPFSQSAPVFHVLLPIPHYYD